MPLGVEARLQQLLNEVVTVSQAIRTSAYAHANGQNFNVFERLRRQLETIRISADAVFEAIAKASLTNYTIDDRMIDWLISGELGSCVSRLKEMEDMLKPDSCARNSLGHAPSRRPTEDKLAATMTFFEKHQSAFHFLITSNVWNCEKAALCEAEAPESNPQPTQSSGTSNSANEQPGYQDASQISMDMRKKDSLRKKFNEVLQWLAALHCTASHGQMLQLRQEATCRWFPKTDAYKTWRTGGGQFLWLHGLAGCGKSVLIASTIEHLEKTLRDEEALVYFYCDFRNERSTSSIEVMRSLLSQMLCYYRDLEIDPGIILSKMLEGKNDGTLLLDDLGKLQELVSRLARTFRYEPIIVIDALDECVDMVSLLGALLELSRDDVRLLVTSRPHPTVSRQFAGLRTLSFEEVAKEVAVDIELHVRREVESHGWLRSTSLETKAEISAKINEKANGRFRWVQCQLDILKRCESEWELKEILDDLPTELEATYEKILEAIDERKSEGELTRRALAWLVVALQPLRLAQLLEGLAVELDQPKINRKVSWPAPALLQTLSSLVSYNEETDILALSHFSVKEYLTNHTALPKYHIIPYVAHAEVARMCMHYISVILTQEPLCNKVAPLKSFPVLSYILSFGFNHVAHVDSRSTIILETIESLGLDVLHHPSHWDHLCQLRENDLQWPSPLWPSSRHDFVLYMLIAYSSAGLFNSFLAWRHRLKPRIGTNPLIYAADLRKTEHALALLTCGADVNARGLIVDDSYRSSPLELAVDRSADVLVGELLERGCVVTSELLTTAVCMPWCSTRVLVRLVYTDEFLTWANEIGDEKLCRSVFNSARPNAGDKDRVALARRLAQVGQDLSPDSPFGAELIERAVYAAHTSMLEYLLPSDQPPHPRFLLAASTGNTSETLPLIRFLLRKGVDINAVSDGRQDTALHLAATCSWEPRSLQLTKMLVEAGCNPRVRNSRAETPLTIAVDSGYVTVADYLLSTGKVLLPSDILPTALRQRAAPEMIGLLIRRGADVRSTSSYGDTVLHLAITRYPNAEKLDILKVFIEAGCDLAVRSSNGKTVLETAIERKYTAVVEFLLSNGVPLPSNILLTALRERSTPRMIETLVRGGADVHSTTSDGNTVLHLAIAEYAEASQLALVKTFIEAGCDPSTCNFSGKTAFEVAVERGYISVLGHLVSCNISIPADILLIALRRRSTLKTIQLLIQAGADVNRTTSDGDTVFHLAIYKYVEETCCCLVKDFIEAGSDANIIDSTGKTVLGAAIERGYSTVVESLLSSNITFPPDILLSVLRQRPTPHVVLILISKGADVCLTTSEGDTVLHLSVAEYSEAECCDLVNLFIKAGCSLVVRNSKGKTPLEAAVKRGYASVVELLLSYCALPPDILLTALRQESPYTMISFLVHRGTDVNCITSDGDTVCHLTITQYPEGVCLMLVPAFVAAGCNLTTRNNKGSTVLDAAIERDYISVVDQLLSYNIVLPPDILLTLFMRQVPVRVHTVVFLIRRGADVRATTPDGDTLLHLVTLNDKEIRDSYTDSRVLVRIFVEAGCDPTARNSSHETALDVAIKCGIYSMARILVCYDIPVSPDTLSTVVWSRLTLWIIQYLLQHGADVHFTTKDGNTPLHLLVFQDVRDVVLITHLVEAGCNLDARNSDRKTALEIAIERGNTIAAEYLISKGADVRSATSDGSTLLHLAITSCGDVSCHRLVEKLLEARCDPMAKNSQHQTALEVAVERNYPLVVEHLLSRDIAFPPELLLNALRWSCDHLIIQLLVAKCDRDQQAFMVEWGTAIEIARARYSGQDLRRVIEILEAARADSDDMLARDAKRRRLE